MTANTRLVSSKPAECSPPTGMPTSFWEHVSLRDERQRGFWIKRPGLGFEELYDTDIQLVDFDGKVLVGAGDPHLERFIHSEILLRTSPDSPRPGTGSAHRQWAAPSHGRWANAMPFCW
ncbi:class II aldolase/adducin family protein [Nocardia abscessus]|uniref:class II aldolase/adducin family protein n=1 Tax=Nocardia abscessus TaxID=120957 RepID=UPI002457C911|nr:class II aldolase/adducin family protein [Nocardia abscessus]